MTAPTQAYDTCDENIMTPTQAYSPNGESGIMAPTKAPTQEYTETDSTAQTRANAES